MTCLRILHCLRAPVGGLFRHVRDLVEEQAAAGHDVGVVCDANSHDRLTAPRLDALASHLTLGLHLVPMARQIGPRDYTAYRAVHALARGHAADILHGHGAKGGAYARLAAHRLKQAGSAISGIYTPHGGSLHYAPHSPQGQLFKYLERILCKRSDAIIFESRFSERRFTARIGRPACLSSVIPNGLSQADFARHKPDPEAAEVLYVGEMRDLKGVDLLIDALSRLPAVRNVRAVLVGDGPDRRKYTDMVAARGLADRVKLPGSMPARDAFALGRLIVVPSRAESFPYIVLEAAAAQIPLIAANVGGIPEIVAGTDATLLQPGDSEALACAIMDHLDNPGRSAALAANLRRSVRQRFTVRRMADDILALYSRTRATRSDDLSAALAVNHG